jgi:hypothetical protein
LKRRYKSGTEYLEKPDFFEQNMKLSVNQQLTIARIQMRYKVPQEKSLPAIVGGAIIHRLFLHCPKPFEQLKHFFHKANEFPSGGSVIQGANGGKNINR